MSLDFTPAPQAAPFVGRVRAHALTEARLLFRNGEQNLLALVIPIGVIIGGRFLGDRFSLPFDVIVASVFALALFSTCFTSVAITTTFERRYSVLERLAATPLGRPGMLLGKSASVVVVYVVQFAILAVVALICGWRPSFDAAHLAVAIPAMLLAAAAFVGGALSLGGSSKPELVLGVANLIYLIGAMAGIMLPVAHFPAAAQPVIALLPTGAFGEAMRYGSLWALPVLAVWAAILLLVARKVFKWTA